MDMNVSQKPTEFNFPLLTDEMINKLSQQLAAAPLVVLQFPKDVLIDQLQTPFNQEILQPTSSFLTRALDSSVLPPLEAPSNSIGSNSGIGARGLTTDDVNSVHDKNKFLGDSGSLVMITLATIFALNKSLKLTDNLDIANQQLNESKIGIDKSKQEYNIKHQEAEQLKLQAIMGFVSAAIMVIALPLSIAYPNVGQTIREIAQSISQLVQAAGTGGGSAYKFRQAKAEKLLGQMEALTTSIRSYKDKSNDAIAEINDMMESSLTFLKQVYKETLDAHSQLGSG